MHTFSDGASCLIVLIPLALGVATLIISTYLRKRHSSPRRQYQERARSRKPQSEYRRKRSLRPS